MTLHCHCPNLNKLLASSFLQFPITKPCLITLATKLRARLKTPTMSTLKPGNHLDLPHQASSWVKHTCKTKTSTRATGPAHSSNRSRPFRHLAPRQQRSSPAASLPPSSGRGSLARAAKCRVRARARAAPSGYGGPFPGSRPGRGRGKPQQRAAAARSRAVEPGVSRRPARAASAAARRCC